MREVKPGDLIALSDEQTLNESGRGGKQLQTSVDFVVSTVRVFEEQNSNVKYTLIEMSNNNLYVVTKQAEDGDGYAMVMFKPDGIMFGNRQDYVYEGLTFIFENDAAGVDQLKDADYAKTIYQEGIAYNQLSEPAYGEVVVGDTPMLFGAVHYRAVEGADTENPELMLLEYGNLEEDDGGYIIFLQGAIIDDTEWRIN